MQGLYICFVLFEYSACKDVLYRCETFSCYGISTTGFTAVALLMVKEPGLLSSYPAWSLTTPNPEFSTKICIIIMLPSMVIAITLI